MNVNCQDDTKKSSNQGSFWGMLATAILIILLNIILCLLDKGIIFTLSDNQILYSFSTMSQVIASLFGLTLTATVFFFQFLQKLKEEDSTYSEVCDALKKNIFRELVLVAIFSIFALILLWLVLHFYTQLDENTSMLNLLINLAEMFFIFSTVIIIIFGIQMLNGNRFDKYFSNVKSNIEAQSKKGNPSSKNNADLFNRFLYYYNSLEELVFDFSDQVKKKSNKTRYPDKKEESRFARGAFYSALNNLLISEIVYQNTFEKIQEIREYRNSLVHGKDFSVSESIYEYLENLYKNLKAVYDAYIDSSSDSDVYISLIQELNAQ